MKLKSPSDTLINSKLSSDDIAKAMKLSSGALLRNKVNPNNTVNHLTLFEASQLIRITGDHSIIHELCQQNNLIAIPFVHDTTPSDIDLIDGMAQSWAANGLLGQTIASAIADGRIDTVEVAAVSKAIYALSATLHALRSRMSEMAE
jgi:hypothetical protein